MNYNLHQARAYLESDDEHHQPRQQLEGAEAAMGNLLDYVDYPAQLYGAVPTTPLACDRPQLPEGPQHDAPASPQWTGSGPCREHQFQPEPHGDTFGADRPQHVLEPQPAQAQPLTGTARDGGPGKADLHWEVVPDDPTEPRSPELPPAPCRPPAPPVEPASRPPGLEELGEPNAPGRDTTQGAQPTAAGDTNTAEGPTNHRVSAPSYKPFPRPPTGQRSSDATGAEPDHTAISCRATRALDNTTTAQDREDDAYWDQYNSQYYDRFGTLDFAQFQQETLRTPADGGEAGDVPPPPAGPAPLNPPGLPPPPPVRQAPGQQHFTGGRTDAQPAPTGPASGHDQWGPPIKTPPPGWWGRLTPAQLGEMSDGRDLNRMRSPASRHSPSVATVQERPEEEITEELAPTWADASWRNPQQSPWAPTPRPPGESSTGSHQPTNDTRRTSAWHGKKQSPDTWGYYQHQWDREKAFTGMDGQPAHWEPFSEANCDVGAATDLTPEDPITWETPQPGVLHTGVVYLFTKAPQREYLHLAAIQYKQGGLSAPLLGVTNQRVDDPPQSRGLPWAHRVACRLLLQKLGLVANKYRLYPTAFRLPVAEKHRPLSRKATHLVAMVAILTSEPNVLDRQAHTDEETYFAGLPHGGGQWVYRGSNDQREMSSTVNWTPFHSHYRKDGILLPHHWGWIDQIAKFIVSRENTPIEWDTDLVALLQLHDRRAGPELPVPASETALRAMLSLYAQSPDQTTVDRHLRRAFVSSAVRILYWAPEATWARPRGVPYLPGGSQDWSAHPPLSVEPMWVLQQP